MTEGQLRDVIHHLRRAGKLKLWMLEVRAFLEFCDQSVTIDRSDNRPKTTETP